MEKMKYTLDIQKFANDLEKAKLMSTALDKVLMQELVTGWTELNAKQVKYTGGDEVKIPEMAMDALADYDRDTGFAKGAVTLKYRTYQFRYDRGREFVIDAMDVDESAFIPTASNVMGEFARTKVVPEVDLIRLATMAQEAGTQEKYAGTTTKARFEAFKKGITNIRKKGYTGQLVAHVTYDTLEDLQLEFKQNLSAVTFKVGGVDTTFQAIDGVALIPTADDRMFVEVEKDETTKAITGTGATIEFLIIGTDVPLGITRHNPVRTFAPNVNQDMDAWKAQYRLFHDLWVMHNKKDAIYLAYKGTLPVTP